MKILKTYILLTSILMIGCIKVNESCSCPVPSEEKTDTKLTVRSKFFWGNPEGHPYTGPDRPEYRGEVFLNEPYYDRNYERTITFHSIKMYIGNIHLWDHSSSEITLLDPHFHLLDAQDTSTLKFEYTNEDLPSAAFDVDVQFGIDSASFYTLEQTSALDPNKGMFMDETHGYLTLAVSGTYSYPDSIENQTFDFRIGGFKHPFKTVQNRGLTQDVMSPFSFEAEYQNTTLYLSFFMNRLFLQDEINDVESPSVEAEELAKRFAYGSLIELSESHESLWVDYEN